MGLENWNFWASLPIQFGVKSIFVFSVSSQPILLNADLSFLQNKNLMDCGFAVLGFETRLI